MRSLYYLPAFAMLAILLAWHSSEAGDGKKKVIKPTKQWTGKKGQNELAKIVHPSGMVTNQKSFQALWSGWMLEGKAPEIDFTKQIIFVQLATGGPNIPRPTYTLDAKGNLTVLSISTLIGGEGFGYSIDALNREGIKTYQGKPLEDAK
jgi:hypothetical protein